MSKKNTSEVELSKVTEVVTATKVVNTARSPIADNVQLQSVSTGLIIAMAVNRELAESIVKSNDNVKIAE